MKNCAVMNDISGFGRCSLTAAISVLSAMGHQVNPMVTGVFTNQTGFAGFSHEDLTAFLPEYIRQWKDLNTDFSGILTGFLLNRFQIGVAKELIAAFRKETTTVLVDPILGDDGQLYPTHNMDMVADMKELCRQATVITPNRTELQLLTGCTWSIEDAGKMLLDEGIGNVVVTGVVEGAWICNYVFTQDRMEKIEGPYLRRGSRGGSISGTGDIFASFVLGKLLQGQDIFTAVEGAGDFIRRAIDSAPIYDRNYGIPYEPLLKTIG